MRFDRIANKGVAEELENLRSEKAALQDAVIELTAALEKAKVHERSLLHKVRELEARFEESTHSVGVLQGRCEELTQELVQSQENDTRLKNIAGADESSRSRKMAQIYMNQIDALQQQNEKLQKHNSSLMMRAFNKR